MTLAAGAGARHALPLDKLSIALTGQALLQSDIRVGRPRAIEEIRALLRADVAFTNLETTIAMPGDSLADLSPERKGAYGPPEVLDALADMGCNLFSTANNHAYDLRTLGIENVIREAEARNLAYAGTGVNLDRATAPGYLSTPHGVVGLVAMATGVIREGGCATESKPGINELPLEGAVPGVDAGRPRAADARRILDSIHAARQQADVVIAYHHNHAYDRHFIELIQDQLPERLVPPSWIRSWAHRLVDAGADIVVLHGIPVVQGVEIYGGRPIFYDMGNFVFQLDAIHKHKFADPRVFQGVIARVEFENRELQSIGLQPIVLDDEPDEVHEHFLSGVPSPATGPRAQSILEQVAELCEPFGTIVAMHGDTAAVDLARSGA